MDDTWTDLVVSTVLGKKLLTSIIVCDIIFIGLKKAMPKTAGAERRKCLSDQAPCRGERSRYKVKCFDFLFSGITGDFLSPKIYKEV